jgi:hypothetical protein
VTDWKGGRVAFETWFDNTRAARLRLMDALLKHRARFDAADTFHHSPRAAYGGSISCLVWIKPEDADAFKADAKLPELRYRSPYRVEGSTIVSIYASPKEELMARAAAIGTEKGGEG